MKPKIIIALIFTGIITDLVLGTRKNASYPVYEKYFNAKCLVLDDMRIEEEHYLIAKFKAYI